MPRYRKKSGIIDGLAISRFMMTSLLSVNMRHITHTVNRTQLLAFQNYYVSHLVAKIVKGNLQLFNAELNTRRLYTVLGESKVQEMHF